MKAIEARNRHCPLFIKHGTHSIPVRTDDGVDKCTGCSLAMTEPEVMDVIGDVGYIRPHRPVELSEAPF